MPEEPEAPPSFWALLRGQTKPRKSTVGQPLPLPNPEATMSLGEYFKFDPLGAAVNVLLGASPVPFPGVPETQASRFGAVLAAGAPLGAGMKSLKALATGEEAAGQAAKGIKAYHGSPHEFEKFALEKIGTGEGAQAYGHGLYFAEHPDVAQSYRDALANNQPSTRIFVNGRPLIEQFAGNNIIASDVGVALERADLDIAKAIRQTDSERTRSYLRDLSEMTISRQPPGRMYEVNIKADPKHFLDWDKPLSEQSPRVQQALRDHLEQLKAQGQTILPDILQQVEAGTLPGSSIYHAFGRGTPESATAALKSRGIPGIKYLDQISRGRTGGELIDTFEKNGQWFAKIRKQNVGGGIGNAPADVFTTSMPLPSKEAAIKWASEQINQGTRNYVISDDALIDILRKYGLLPPVVGGTLGLSQLARPSQPQGQQ
jgi:hypothetical protein